MKKPKLICLITAAALLLSNGIIPAGAAAVSLQEGQAWSTMFYRGSTISATFQPSQTGVYRIYTTGELDTVCTLYTGGGQVEGDDTEYGVNCEALFLGLAGREYQCDFSLSRFADADGMTELCVERMESVTLTAGQTVRQETHGVLEGEVDYQRQAYLFTPEQTGSYTLLLRISATDCNEQVDLYDENMNLIAQADHYYEADERVGTNAITGTLIGGETYLLLATEWIYSTGNVVLSASVQQNSVQEDTPPVAAEEPDTTPDVDQTEPDEIEAPTESEEPTEPNPDQTEAPVESDESQSEITDGAESPVQIPSENEPEPISPDGATTPTTPITTTPSITITAPSTTTSNVSVPTTSTTTYTPTIPVTGISSITPTVTTPIWENPFTDVKEGKWYYEAVRFCCLNSLFQGTSETTFAPDLPMTRGMLVKVLYSMSGVEDYPVSYVFDDVYPKAWYAQAVSWAYANGIVQGMGNNTFEPNSEVTREQMVKILMSYYHYYLGKTPRNQTELIYSDVSDVSRWGLEPLQWAVGNGLINGVSQPDGSVLLDPKGYATRAQVAAIMQRFDELVY